MNTITHSKPYVSTKFKSRNYDHGFKGFKLVNSLTCLCMHATLCGDRLLDRWWKHPWVLVTTITPTPTSFSVYMPPIHLWPHCDNLSPINSGLLPLPPKPRAQSCISIPPTPNPNPPAISGVLKLHDSSCVALHNSIVITLPIHVPHIWVSTQ